ncbi:dihydroxyacetone kinase [Glonium stellatum]|uniref:Dihydroxyacetone kinase n=1 Tax=Glonium stellatum TaxID=574774 RepID=A0A8E2EVD9_9PEZI|nr:dihydroxyacetone kinase [Glonium stellatum]
MSRKHFFPSTDGVVVHALNSFIARNPHLELDEPNRVVYSKVHSPSQVTIISGGGSGHEPAWSGYVGDGMLSAAVNGDVFASPSTKQIMAAIKNVPSDVGIILCITNYTGDKLHFGLAREKGLALGYKISVVNMAEDAALGRKKSELVGRRGLAGNLLVLKLVGAASQLSWSFERCLQLGNLGNDQLVTIGTSLDHCHVPGRAHHEAVAEDACVVGMGIHNEPGLRTISPMPSAEDVLKEMFLCLLDPSDSDRAFVKFEPKDEVVMLVNNFGGLSGLELEALTNLARVQLERDWKISPCRIYAGIMETSLNAPGFSITLGNISGIARVMNVSTAEIIDLLDQPTTAPAWPKNGYAPAKESEETLSLRQKAGANENTATALNKGSVVSESLIHSIREACTRAIKAEPDITKYDIQMGDGDCGEAVESVCKSILSKLDTATAQTPIFELLDHIGESVEDMGGSLGAILSILLTAFLNNLRAASAGLSVALDTAAVGKAAELALENLKLYTSARAGDRTVMDVLIPFCEVLGQTSDLDKAVAEAEKKAQATAGMKARFGRATYVGDEKAQNKDMPPDPGAYAAAVFLRGLLEGKGA